MKKAKKQWGNLTLEQTKEIIEGAGERRINYHYFSWHFPFVHRCKDILVLGGNCSCCGRWNWQWCLKGWEWTAPCQQCVEDSKDFNLEGGKK